MTDEQAAEMVATLKRIEELLIGLVQAQVETARTQTEIARTLSILVGSAQHGRSRG